MSVELKQVSTYYIVGNKNMTQNIFILHVHEKSCVVYERKKPAFYMYIHALRNACC